MADPDRMSPRAKARVAGVLYVLEGVTSVAGALLIPGRFVVPGDAAATAANIQGHEALYLLGITASLVSVGLHAALIVFLYDLFKPVGRLAAMLFASLGLMAIVLQAVSALLQLPAPVVLGAAGVSGPLGVEGAQALARASLSLRAQAFNLYLGFFGLRCAALGYLVFRSAFMPRLIGVLLWFTGLGYLPLLWRPLAEAVTPFNFVFVAPGELSFVFWILLAGVNGALWTQQAAAARD